MFKTLAVEYRPQTFNDVVEQTTIINILETQMKNEDIRNAYLFTGGAGTGKTTSARIFANELNDGIGSPIEIDAASNNGVDDVRAINERAQTLSLDSKFKVYIIDECHMLTTAAWNAMLKLIEEPPAMTVFIFCTTDPQKIPATIMSRVQRYDFMRISYDGVKERLNHILEEEFVKGDTERLQNGWDGTMEDLHGKEYPEVIDFIAKVADGGMRDAITMLDKMLGSGLQLTIENAVTVLQLVSYDQMFELTEAVIDGEQEKVIEVIDELHNSGADIKRFIRSYVDFIIDISKYNITESMDQVRIPTTYEDTIIALEDVADGWFDGYMRMLLGLMNEIKWDNNPRQIVTARLMLACLEEM